MICEILISWWKSVESTAIKYTLICIQIRDTQGNGIVFYLPSALLCDWHVFIGTHCGVNISVVQGRCWILWHRHNIHERLGIKHEISFISEECIFFCISTMTPGLFISSIGRIHLSDLHMKDPHFLFNKKGTCFNFKEVQIMKRTLW